MDDLEIGAADSIEDALNAGFDAAETAEQTAADDDQPEPSLEDVLGAQFDRLQSGEGEEQPAEAKPAEAPAEPPELAEFKQFHDEVSAALAPWEPVLAQQGLSKAQTVQSLVNLYQGSVQDPVGFLTGLASRYAPTMVDPAQRAALVDAFARGMGVAQIGAGGAATGASNGANNPIEHRLSSIEQTIQAQKYAAQQAQMQQAQAVMSSAQSAIQEFAQAKAEDGKPAHPHFEAVKVTMGALMQADPKLSLEDAYTSAVWTKPEIRESLTKAQQEQQARAAAEQRRRGIAKARAAQTPRGASVPTPPEDVSDLETAALLERTWKALGFEAR